MQLFERLCATFLHTMPNLFPPAVSIVVGRRYFDAVALIFFTLTLYSNCDTKIFIL